MAHSTANTHAQSWEVKVVKDRALQAAYRVPNTGTGEGGGETKSKRKKIEDER
jgi:hypothetical protein